MSSVAKLLPITHLIAIWSIPVEPEAVEVKLNSCKCSFKSFLLSLFAAVLPCFREGSYQFCLNSMSRPFYLVVTDVEVPLSWPGGHKVGASCWWVLGAGGTKQHRTQRRAPNDTVMSRFLAYRWPQLYPVTPDPLKFCLNQLH